MGFYRHIMKGYKKNRYFCLIKKAVVFYYYGQNPHISGYSLESCSPAELSSALPDVTKQIINFSFNKCDIGGNC